MSCFISHTGSFLPGEPVENGDIERYLGRLWGESKVKKQILAANRIKQRYYAQDARQQPTFDVYDMAARSVRNCLDGAECTKEITYLSAGSTNTPHVGPGLASILHSRLSDQQLIEQPIEINSNSGICSSAAQAFVNGCRAIELGAHAKAVCVGVEHASEVLKSTVVRPQYDLRQMFRDVKRSKWFMTVFLRFMLSDGAGCVLLQRDPPSQRQGYQVNWTYCESFAHEAPLCMKLESRSLLLSQDIHILSKYLGPCVRHFIRRAMEQHQDRLANYQYVLPHISSYYFVRVLKSVMREQSAGDDDKPDFWTNLSTVGNTGAASIFILLDEFTKTQQPSPGTRILLFVPESGQFNFVLISLTVV